MAFEIDRPSGTVTFLFTDVEGSTRLWEERPDEMGGALERHDVILRAAIEGRGGYVFSTGGDAFAAAFGRVDDAVGAAVAAQAELASVAWPQEVEIRVRIGVHTGEAQERDGDYFGSDVNRAARIMSCAHGGQIVLSSSVAAVRGTSGLMDLGEHRLKDLGAPEQLWQVGRTEFESLRTLDRAQHNLPVMRTPLLGREDDLVRVVGHLSEVTLVSLTGIGGTGKTRLALAAAASVTHEYPDGVWFVDLVPVTNPDDLPRAVARAAGLDLGSGGALESLIGLLVGRNALFVLDNCEHLTDGVADLVDAILERTDSSTLLVTSREPLGLVDEQQVVLDPLVADGEGSPAVELFVATARRAGVEVSEGNRPLVIEVCRRLDGLPLAIELAAGQLRHLSLADLLDRLDQRFELLGGAGRGRRRRRQTSLQAVLEETWGMLDDSEQELLRQLAAFPAEFDLDQIEATTGSVASRALAGLIGRSLVAPSADRTSYRLLETVKLFTQGTWNETTTPDQYLDRHASALLEQIDNWSDDDRYMQLSIAGWHIKHLDDLRAADDHLNATHRAAEAAKLWTSGAIAWHLGTPTIALSVIDRLDRLLERDDLSPETRARTELAAAVAAMAARDPKRIITSAEKAVSLAAEAGLAADVVRAFALNVQSWMTMVKDLDGALALLHESEETAIAADAPLVALAARGYAGLARAIHGDLSARNVIPDIESAAPTEGTYVWNSTGSLALVCDLFERPLDAGQQFAAGLEAQKDRGIPKGWQEHNQLALVQAAAGKASATDVGLEAAERELRRSGNDDGLPDLLLGPAILASTLGQRELSARWLTAVRLSPKPTQNLQTTSIFRQLRERVGLTVDTTNLDDTQAVYAEARAWIHEAALTE